MLSDITGLSDVDISKHATSHIEDQQLPFVFHYKEREFLFFFSVSYLNVNSATPL